MEDSKIKKTDKSHTTLPLVFNNLKKTFKQNIKGPILHREREYKATIKHRFLFDVTDFLYIRGIDRLIAINAWETENNFDLAYHFVSNIGNDILDTKLTLIAFLPKNEKETKSIKKLFPNASLFENDIAKKYNIKFID